MSYVPGKTLEVSFQYGGEATVENAYLIGEAEVTYELWAVVHTWAIANGYVFDNAGTMGDGTGDTARHPVTTVNWKDCLVWCNAATEWYNSKNGTSHTCVYMDAGTPIRDTGNANCESVVPEGAATGFRLPGIFEWELAASFIDDANEDGDIMDAGECYPRDTASGVDNEHGLDDVAWYEDNSGDSTHEIKTRAANALDLYDMNGNVWEWCFDKSLNSDSRLTKGAGYGDMAMMVQVGGSLFLNASYSHEFRGFRLAMNYNEEE
jgi:formylglycine-generating enzyme required for sulfatase activity